MLDALLFNLRYWIGIAVRFVFAYALLAFVAGTYLP